MMSQLRLIKMLAVAVVCYSCCLIGSLHATSVTTVTVTSTEWINFKRAYGKVYATSADESNALYYYNYNSKLVAKHNAYYEIGTYTYSLRINQFADLNLVGTLPTRFPVAVASSTDNSQAAPAVSTAPTAYDPRVNDGIPLNVLDQGTVCSSGWAYATASAVELKNALETFNAARPIASAQQLIDCAGLGTACTTQVPQAGLDYLTLYSQRLRPIAEYPNVPTASAQRFCVPPTTASGVPVTRYSRINDNADSVLAQYVGNGFPVVVEYNPTSYQFMLYGEGVFQQPSVGRGSHFMTVVGYGRDTTRNLDYWLVQNSFGTQWGELGVMRVIRATTKPLAKSAIFPSLLF